MPTLLTDPRSGGTKKSSGVNVLPIIASTWAQVRSDTHESTYLLATYSENSKTDITLYDSGPGGIEAACQNLPKNKPIFGGARLSTGRFVSFTYHGDEVGIMLRGRSSMHKNGVFNVLQGCDVEIEVWSNMTEEHVSKSFGKENVTSDVSVSEKRGKSTLQIAEQTGKDISVHHPVHVPRQSAMVPHPCTTTTNTDNNNNNKEPMIVPYETLKSITDSTTLGIDPRQKELALSDEEFEKIFQMSKVSFASLANWKKTQLKKAASLF